MCLWLNEMFDQLFWNVSFKRIILWLDFCLVAIVIRLWRFDLSIIMQRFYSLSVKVVCLFIKHSLINCECSLIYCELVLLILYLMKINHFICSELHHIRIKLMRRRLYLLFALCTSFGFHQICRSWVFPVESLGCEWSICQKLCFALSLINMLF